MNKIILAILSLFTLSEFEKIQLPLEIESNFRNYEIIEINNEIYIYSALLDASCSVIFYNVSGRDTLSLDINPLFSFRGRCNKDVISNICRTNDTIIFVYRSHLLLYQLVNQSFEFIDALDLNEIFSTDRFQYATKLHFDNNMVIGLFDNFHSRYESSKNFFAWTININNYNDFNLYYLNFPSGYYWTLFQPRNLIDYNKKHYLTASATKYEIILYDNLTPIDTIKRTDIPWSATEFNINEFSGKHPMEIIGTLQSDSNTRNLIHRVNFLDSNKIIVLYSDNTDEFLEKSSKLYNFKYDIWVKTSESWEFSHHDIAIEDSNFHISYASYKIYNDMIYFFVYDENYQYYLLWKKL